MVWFFEYPQDVRRPRWGKYTLHRPASYGMRKIVRQVMMFGTGGRVNDGVKMRQCSLMSGN